MGSYYGWLLRADAVYRINQFAFVNSRGSVYIFSSEFRCWYEWRIDSGMICLFVSGVIWKMTVCRRFKKDRRSWIEIQVIILSMSNVMMLMTEEKTIDDGHILKKWWKQSHTKTIDTCIIYILMMFRNPPESIFVYVTVSSLNQKI